MARQLADQGISSDIFDRGALRERVETLALLPESDPARADRKPIDVSPYAAILQIGAWQNPLWLHRLLSARRPEQKLFYLPRGGLAEIEFVPPLGRKKRPYFALIERRMIARAAGIVFSSSAEQRETIPQARRLAPEHVIPDFVESPAITPSDTAPGGARVNFAFLAEIAPRKGLLPLVEAFTQWARTRNLGDKVQLTIGGGVRPGSEPYAARAREVARGSGEVRIVFLGPVAHGDRGRFYGGTDIMVVPSRFESFGLTLLEALQEGCSLLTAPNIGALEFLPESDTRTTATGADPESLMKGLDEAYGRFLRLGAVARPRAAEVGRTAAAAINASAGASWFELLR